MFVNFCERPHSTTYPSSGATMALNPSCVFSSSPELIALSHSLSGSGPMRQVGSCRRQMRLVAQRPQVSLPHVRTHEDDNNYYLIMEKPRETIPAFEIHHESLFSSLQQHEQHPFDSYQFKIQSDKLMVRSLKDQYFKSFDLPEDADKSQHFQLQEFHAGSGLVVSIKKVVQVNAQFEQGVAEFANMLVSLLDHAHHQVPNEIHRRQLEQQHQKEFQIELQKKKQLQAKAELEVIERKKAEALAKAKEQQQKAAELKRQAHQRKLNEFKENRRLAEQQKEFEKQQQAIFDSFSDLFRIPVQCASTSLPVTGSYPSSTSPVRTSTTSPSSNTIRISTQHSVNPTRTPSHANSTVPSTLTKSLSSDPLDAPKSSASSPLLRNYVTTSRKTHFPPLESEKKEMELNDATNTTLNADNHDSSFENVSDSSSITTPSASPSVKGSPRSRTPLLEDVPDDEFL
ncbi:unnamed protein product [Ambrosiozyma monospora]|uniref:Unnamed protein product n=1 Tax=Ambrosiozyma monospora TaxID=43982 RepID=A0A9W6Z672_AMBMO|nr:unnamed protein product [Ambrosiozyma monospora]